MIIHILQKKGKKEIYLKILKKKSFFALCLAYRFLMQCCILSTAWVICAVYLQQDLLNYGMARESWMMPSRTFNRVSVLRSMEVFVLMMHQEHFR